MSDLHKARLINAVALELPKLIRFLDQQMTAKLGTNQHNIILLVGAGDVSQYAANVPREYATAVLVDLLGRWRANVPSGLPGEVAPGNTQAFEYLLGAYEAALAGSDATPNAAATNRFNLIEYVGRLLAENARRAA